jgi:hypothetical protein
VTSRPLVIRDAEGRTVDISNAREATIRRVGIGDLPDEDRYRAVVTLEDGHVYLVGPETSQAHAQELADRLTVRISAHQRAGRAYEPVRLLPDNVHEIRVRYKTLPGVVVSTETIVAILQPHLLPLVSELEVQESWL